MCGIVGYIGNKDAYPILIEGLKRLEYRGYDSAGVALINGEGTMNIYKEKGKVSNLEAIASQRDTSGTIGIAHTRWATHGEPSAVNAHPHVSQNGRLALVHNGIIENYASLKEYLTGKGYTFKSCTDTEVLVQLIQFMQDEYGKDLEGAVIMALRRVVGAYAIAVIDKEQDWRKEESRLAQADAAIDFSTPSADSSSRRLTSSSFACCTSNISRAVTVL